MAGFKREVRSGIILQVGQSISACRWATPGSKITALALGSVGDSAVRSDIRAFEVAGSSSKCAVASIVCLRRCRVLRNELLGAGSARSVGTVDGQWLRWLDYVPGGERSGDTRPRRCFLSFWLRHWQLD